MQRIALLILLLFTLTQGTAHAATYSFTGTNYVDPVGVYTTSMRVSGWFSTAEPLPPNMPKTEIGPKGSNVVTALRFTDGVHTWTHENSVAAIDSSSLFSVSTDTEGNIAGFHLSLMSPLPPHSVGTEINVFNIRDDTNVYTRVYNLGTCSALTPDNVCRSISQPVPPPGGYVDYTLLPVSERPSTGTFVTIQEERPAARPIPSLSVPAMLLLGIILAWLAWRNHRSRATA